MEKAESGVSVKRAGSRSLRQPADECVFVRLLVELGEAGKRAYWL